MRGNAQSPSVYGVGLAIVDIEIPWRELSFVYPSVRPGSTGLILPSDVSHVLALTRDGDVTTRCGGSVANSLCVLRSQGIDVGFAGRTAEDSAGTMYRQELADRGIHRTGVISRSGHTAACLVSVGSGGERTILASLGVSRDFDLNDVDLELTRRAAWLFIEGTLLCNGPRTQEAVDDLIRVARRDKVKIALTVGSTHAAEKFTDRMVQVARASDLLFANEDEAKLVTSIEDPYRSFCRLKTICPGVVMTQGSRGGMVRYGSHEFSFSAQSARPVDTTGAGDAFAGAFLGGLLNGVNPEKSARDAAAVARRVVEQTGARLPTNREGDAPRAV